MVKYGYYKKERQVTANDRDDVKLAVLNTKLDNIKEKLDSVDSKVSSHYVSKDEFEPIKRVVYGLVGLILFAVVGAIVALVIK